MDATDSRCTLHVTTRHNMVRMLHGKSKELEKRVNIRAKEVAKITQSSYISNESLAIIIMLTEAELEREIKNGISS